jgi:hypothetical protein
MEASGSSKGESHEEPKETNLGQFGNGSDHEPDHIL